MPSGRAWAADRGWAGRAGRSERRTTNTAGGATLAAVQGSAEIDLAKVDEARGKVPSLTHDREFAGPNLYDAALREAGE